MSSFIYNNLQTITRLLQQDNSNNTTDDDNNSASTITQTEMIRNACILYGSIFIALFILFIIVRPCYPKVYNIKKSYPKLQQLHREEKESGEDREGGDRIDENEYHAVDNDNNLPNINDDINSSNNNNTSEAVCNDSYGMISWMYKQYDASYDQICDECGVDAVTTIRLLEMGVKLSLVGVFNSAFLVPVYALLGDVVAQSGTPDPVKGVSLSNLNQGSIGTIATTLSAYIFFSSSMYFISQDLNWFTIKRHEYLCKRLVMNYSIYVSGLPDGMKSNGILKDYFNNCFSSSYFAHHHHGTGRGTTNHVNGGGEEEVTNVVASANVALNIPNLQKEVDKRTALISKLEHVINVEQVKGITPTHKANGIRGSVIGAQTVDSVPTYTEELQELNEDIGNRIDNIMKRVKARDMEGGEGDGEAIAEADVEAGDVGTTRGGDVMTTTTDAHTAVQALPPEEEEEDKSADTPKYKRAASRLSDTVKVGTSVVKSIIFNDKEDGDARNAAFVSFNNLTSANLARQAVHNQRAWSVVAQKAPLPELVNWKNVGKSNISKQVGEFLSLVFSLTLCIFWTVPVAFVSSLSNVDKLTETFTFLEEPVSKYPWFAELLAILAPFILVVFVSLLPYILLAFVKFEGLIEIETMQHPSLFTKLASFTIIQTFFISTIAGTLFASIQDIIQNPTQGVKDIASALPEQSAYFIQIIIVQNLPPLGIELLRISPIVQNILRGIVSNRLGHDLTEKERTSTFMGLRSLNDPLEYYFGRELGSKTILAMMTLYVYGSGMAPITSYFTLIVFGFLAIGFRHQFIYIYPIGNDSGGDLWIRFTRISITCMIVAEIVLLIVLFLKEAFIAGVLLVPLPIATILFDQYFKRRHYAITANLPLGDCAVVDRKNEGTLINEWLKDAYLQPALKKRSEFPDNYNGTDDEDGDLKDDAVETRAADDHKLRGNEHLAKKEYELALHHYTQAIETAPSGPSSHIYYCNRAAAYCYVGEYQAAADDCLSSIQLKPDYEKAYTRLGLALFFQGDYEAAVDAYQKSLVVSRWG